MRTAIGMFGPATPCVARVAACPESFASIPVKPGGGTPRCIEALAIPGVTTEIEPIAAR